jgi:hypothetical protein
LNDQTRDDATKAVRARHPLAALRAVSFCGEPAYQVTTGPPLSLVIGWGATDYDAWKVAATHSTVRHSPVIDEPAAARAK